MDFDHENSSNKFHLDTCNANRSCIPLTARGSAGRTVVFLGTTSPCNSVAKRDWLWRNIVARRLICIYRILQIFFLIVIQNIRTFRIFNINIFFFLVKKMKNEIHIEKQNIVDIFDNYLIILPAVRETSIFFVITECVPKSQGDIHVVDYFPGSF